MVGINPFFIFLPLRRAKGGVAQEGGGAAQEEGLPSFIIFLQRQIMTKRPISQLKRRHVLGPNVLDMFKKLQEKKAADATSEFNSSNEDEKGDDEGETLGKVVFQYKWLQAWKWMRYDSEIDAVFCTTCEAFAIAGHSPYTKGGCQNFKTSSFREHGRSKGHSVAAARKADAEKPKKPVVVAIHAMHEKIDGAILNLFKAAYTVAARSWSFNDFQYLIDLLEEDYVDITSAHVKTMDLAIDCYYIKDPPADLNAFLEDRSGYPIIPDYDPSRGHLEALRSSLHGKEYRGFEIVREKDGSDLELAIIQQKAFAKAIYDGLNTIFKDASILKHFSVLSPRNLPNAMKSRKFGEESLKELTKFYGIAKDVAALQQKVPPLVSETSIQREYSDYKIHAAANWHNMDLEEVCMAIASSPSNALWFKNVLTLLQIALVQCASNAICERIFSSRTSVKDRSRARMGVDSLNACLSIVVNGPKNAQDFNFERSLQIWKGKANRQIYTGESSRHLN